MVWPMQVPQRDTQEIKMLLLSFNVKNLEIKKNPVNIINQPPLRLLKY